MENSNEKIISKDSSDNTIRRKRSEASVTVALPKPITNSRNQFPQRPLHLKPPPHPPTQHSCLTKSLIQDDATASSQTVMPQNMEDLGRCLKILLQHDLPEDLARSLVEDAADVGHLIDTIQTVAPGAKDLLRALADPLLAVPKHKRPWFQVMLKHGVPKDTAAAFIRNIVGGVAELADKLRDEMPDDADALLKKVFPLYDSQRQARFAVSQPSLTLPAP